MIRVRYHTQKELEKAYERISKNPSDGTAWAKMREKGWLNRPNNELPEYLRGYEKRKVKGAKPQDTETLEEENDNGPRTGKF